MATTAPRRLPFTAVTKPAGAACNLSCTYCFFLSKELLHPERVPHMSEEVLRTYLARYLEAQPDGPVTVVWQGGEPTLRGLDFFRHAVRTAAALARPGQRVTHALQTNGTLLDDAWGRFLADEGVVVGLSVDGPAHLHDAYRVNRGGRGTHAMVECGWRVLQEHGVEANVLCTVHAANAGHPLEVYRYLRDELGARHIQLIPVVERVPADRLAVAEAGWDGPGRPRPVLYRQEGTATTSRSVDPHQWGAFLTAVFTEWLAHDVGTVHLQHVEMMVGNLLGRYSLCVHAPECGRAPAVDHTGDVYSCDHYVEPGYRLGSCTDTPFTELLSSPAQRDFGRAKWTALPARCVSCPVRWACHGGCPKDRFVEAVPGEAPLNYLCAGYSAFFSAAEPAARAMASLVSAGRPASDVMKPAWRARLARHTATPASPRAEGPHR